MGLIFKEECYAIVGAAIEVHKQLGHGFLEAVYQEALDKELTERGIPFRPKAKLEIEYKEALLDKHYEADFICYEKIVVEIKSAETLTSKDTSQVINYLKATGLRLGILINFGSEGKLEWRRLVN